MGELFALAAAVSWAFSVILFRKSGQTVAPFSLNLFRVTVSSLVFLGLLAALGQEIWSHQPRHDYLVLFLSGTIGIVLSDTMFHRSLNRVGAGIMGIVSCFYSPSVVIVAYVLIGERLGPWQLVGMVLVIAGVLTTTRVHPPAGTTRGMLISGILWGVAAMATNAIGIVIAKPVLEHSPVLWATAIRQFSSLLIMAPIALLLPRRRRILAVFRPVATWKYSLSGTLLASVLALLFWIGGMKYTQMGTAAILNQTGTIHVLILASVLLHEPFTRRKLAAALLALGGILLVIRG